MTTDPTPANAARLAMRCVQLEAENEKLRQENEQLRAADLKRLAAIASLRIDELNAAMPADLVGEA